MKRTYINKLHDHIGEKVKIAGWVDTRRDHGKLIFLDLRDKTGKVQMVALPNHESVHEQAGTLRPEWVIEVTGMVNKRPEKMVNGNEPQGDIEIELTSIDTLSKAAELPFDTDGELNLDTYLDHLPLTLRSEHSKDIFTLQAALIQAFRNSLSEQDFMEYQNPVLVGEDGEGGAAAFRVDYFKDKNAYLATSPQLYKQIMVGVFERVFTTTKVFRAEKHATTRHLSEIVQLDFEMGFIESHLDIMHVLEQVMRDIAKTIGEKHADILKRFNTELPSVPKNIFPKLTLSEAQEILEKEYALECIGEPDLEPEHERKICEWAKKEYDSDFLFITHFPSTKRPFYTFDDPGDKHLSRSFDLLFRGLEINSGSQRIHEYDALVEKLKSKGLDPEHFSFYLEAFKYGMPPHGGCSTGLERLTARFLELDNVKRAALFPRDINRIDRLLSEPEEGSGKSS